MVSLFKRRPFARFVVRVTASFAVLAALGAALDALDALRLRRKAAQQRDEPHKLQARRRTPARPHARPPALRSLRFERASERADGARCVHGARRSWW
jgi:hypothetical protein